jgi:hypothetical protein
MVQQNHLPGITRQQVAGRKSADSKAQRENCREQSGVGEGKAKGLADVCGENREEIAIRGHQDVGKQ